MPPPDTRSQPAAAARGAIPRLDRARSLLLVVDVQERLAPHVQDHAVLIARVEALLGAAERLGVARMATEHAPDRIGPLVAQLRPRFAPGELFVKTRFGACDHPAFAAQVRDSGRTQVVIAGMEAHVCVLQTALGLAQAGLEVFVAADAVGSRAQRQDDRSWALGRLQAAGCTLAGVETVLFEWTRAADDAAFADVLRLVKLLP